MARRIRERTAEAQPAAPRQEEAALAGSARSLDPQTRRSMETAFRSNFGDVRVHTGSAAGAAARGRRAAAYTLGRDIVFAPGRYAPETGPGRRLLAHELAHVLQQRRGDGDSERRSESGSAGPLEQQAGRAAQEAAAGQVVQTALSPAPAAVQRSPEGEEEPKLPQATKSALKWKFKTFKTKIGEISLKLAVSPSGSGKARGVPKPLTPEMEVEISNKVAFKLKSDVLNFSTDEWPYRLGGLGFKSKLSAEFMEGELSDGVLALNVAKIKVDAQSTDLARRNFGADVKLEIELKVKPEHLLRGADKKLLKQFEKLMGDTQKTTQRIAKHSEEMKKAEDALSKARKELAQGETRVERLSKRSKGKRSAGKQALKDLKAEVRKLRRTIAGHEGQIERLTKEIKGDKKLLRRITEKAANVVRSSKNPMFRLLTSAMAKAVGKQLARLIPVIGALTLAYDVVVLLRNLALGRLSWGVGGEGDPWGEGKGQPGAAGGKPGAKGAEAVQQPGAQGKQGGRGGQAGQGGAAQGKQGESTSADAGAPAPAPGQAGKKPGTGGDKDVAEKEGAPGGKGGKGGKGRAGDEGEGEVEGEDEGKGGKAGVGGAPAKPDAGQKPGKVGGAKGGAGGAGGAPGKKAKRPAPEPDEEAEPGGGKKKGGEGKAGGQQQGGKRGPKGEGDGGGKRSKEQQGSGVSADKIISVHSNLFTRIQGYDPRKPYKVGDEFQITASFTVGRKHMRRSFRVIVDTLPHPDGDQVRAVVLNKDEWAFTVGKKKHVMAAGEPIELISGSSSAGKR